MKFLKLNLFRVVVALGFLGTISTKAAYENYTFITLAGPTEGGLGARDGTGTFARFASPSGIARDSAGNIYIADASAHTIRKISTSGMVTTLAGLAGISGTNDGLGSVARFNAPNAVAVDSSGSVYVADTGNDTIRKITPAGLVTTIAGLAGVPGSANGNGTSARFSSPYGITVTPQDELLVADTFNNVIRKIDSVGQVTTFAGTGSPGTNDNNKATSAGFFRPISTAFDSAGNIYVTDTGNHTIRKIAVGGAVSTLAGAPGASGTANGTNGTARFNTPYSLTVDASDDLYVADTFNHTIRKVTASGVVTTYAGFGGVSGQTDDAGSAARFNFPVGIISIGTNLFIGDYSNSEIRKIAPGAVVTTYAGAASSSGSAEGDATEARFKFPTGIAVTTNGTIFVTDLGNDTIRKISTLGEVTTFAGTVGTAGTNDGNNATFNDPTGVAVDTDGNVYVADQANHTIRKITALGDVSTFAGKPGVSGTNDGVGDAARFNRPFCLTLDSSNNVYVADTWNHAIRKITPGGSVSTIAGTIGTSGTNDGNGVSAKFSFPEGIALDSAGNLYVGDDGNSTVRKIDTGGNVTTFAGSAGVTGSTDDTANAARFNFPFGVAVDASGNVFVADTGNSLIRKINPGAVVSTLAGLKKTSGIFDGTGPDARFNSPEGIAVDAAGNVYVTDASNHSIRKGYPSISDTPVVDSATNRIGVVRHLSISNLTTTSWSWSFMRYPSGSSAQLSSTNSVNPSFTPDAEDLYIIRFQGWDNQGRTTIRTLNVVADNTAPTVGISAPTQNQQWSNSVFTVTGTTSDNFGIAGTWYRINGGAWTPVNGTTNWSASVGLVPGTNVIETYSMDTAGNISATNSVNLIYVVSASGTYAGLFYNTNGVTATNAGYFIATVTGGGSFSGSLYLGKKPLKLTGTFSAGGIFSNSVIRKGLSPLSVQLQLDLSGGDRITGRISDGVWIAELTANRNVYSAGNPAPEGGKQYTLVIPGATNAAVAPGGYSYGTLTVDSLGNLTFSGLLADNTKMTQRTFISKDGQWPFYAPLYSGAGVILGWISFTNQPASDLSGTVVWIKMPGAKSKLYLSGFNFDTGLQAFGSQFVISAPLLDLPNGGEVVLAGGNLPQSSTNHVTIGLDNKVTGTNGVSLTLSTKNGLFKGVAPNPGGKSLKAGGVVLQKQNSAYGTFLGPTQSGSLSLTPD